MSKAYSVSGHVYRDLEVLRNILFIERPNSYSTFIKAAIL